MKIKTDEDGFTVFYDSEKLPSGQTIKIEFGEEFFNNTYYYNIYLSIMHKRRQEDFSCTQRTGKDGLKGVLWARDKIIEFEEFIKDEKKKDGFDTIILCRWTCNKRRDMYYRGLKSIGYEYNHLFGGKVIAKKI